MVASNQLKLTALTLSLGIIASMSVNVPALAKSKAGSSKTATTTKTSAQSDEAAIRAQIVEMGKQLAAGNAALLAAIWAEDGEYVDEDGNKCSGRKQIQDRFTAVFSQDGKPQVHLLADSIKFLAPTVAIVEGKVQRDRGNQSLPDSQFSLVMVKGANGWLLSRASESPVVSRSNYDYLRQLDWIIGEWDAKGPNATVHLKAEWVPSKNFIVCKYETKKNDGTVSVDMQIVGWDPILGQPRSWHFDSTGGYGQGFWSKVNNQWVCDASGVETDGSTTKSRNIMTVKGKDTFDWTSVNRSVDGMAVGDAPALQVQRIN
ncbi:MAG: SgcJ/EcaC family oxidoreductase [Cyanobacteria bacterium SZAS LIN-3]|nr:SgcJ/EcaC family oxidoreductase [Cyanobacteria bacterium SZAS LIN-3]